MDCFDIGPGAHRQARRGVSQIVDGQRLKAERLYRRGVDVAPKVGVVEHPPAEFVKTRSLGDFDARNGTSSSTMNLGIGTVRRL